MSGETKWTPGPWRAQAHSDPHDLAVWAVNGSPYHVATVTADTLPHEKARANAHLLASAPRLYAALAALLDAFPVDCVGYPAPEIKAADAAPAAARGEKP